MKDLKYSIIANGHGPVLRHNLEELVGRYKSWSESVGKAAASVAVLYSSDYGFSDRWLPMLLLTPCCFAVGSPGIVRPMPMTHVA